MKKALKIFGITLGSIIGLMVVVVGVALWLLLTPERLTPIVRDVAKEYVTCEHEIGKVEWTFLSTFPRCGLNIDSIVVINQMPGAKSDTVLAAPKLLATVDIAELLQEKLHIYELRIPDVEANIFINEAGKSNLDIFNIAPDTTSVEEDSTVLALPFKDIRVDALQVSAKQVSMVSMCDTIDVAVAGMSLDAQVESMDDMHVQLAVASADVAMQGVEYAKGLSISLDIPAAVDMETIGIQLRQAQLAVNQFGINIDGWLNFQEKITMDMHLSLQEWQISEVLALVPPTLLSSMEGITADGVVSLDAHAKGVYSNQSMPVVDAHVVLQDGEGKYAELPYTFSALALDATLHLDMQNPSQTKVDIRDLRASTGRSKIEGKGQVTDLLGDMQIDVATKCNVLLADAKYFLPKDMTLDGRVKGDVKIQIGLNDLITMELERGKILGDLRLKGIHYTADSMDVILPNNKLRLQIPNANPSRKEVGWLAGNLYLQSGNANMTGLLQADMAATSIALEMSNILSNEALLHATLTLEAKEHIRVVMDSMDITAMKPMIAADVTYNMQDIREMPKVDAQIGFERLYGHYTDIHADITQGALTANLDAPRLKAGIEVQTLVASMGEELQAKTEKVAMTAAARYNKDGGDNLLLTWRPRLDVDLNQAEVTIADWEKKVLIPKMDFSYSNRKFHIAESRLLVGNSDFELTGELRHIGRWLRDKGTLEGELNFTSNRTDVDELLALISADEGSLEEAKDKEVKGDEAKGDEAKGDEAKEEESEPFLVPNNVDLVLNTQIKQAQFLNQTASDLGGKVYMKDGALVLEEVGFICNAAKLQLTAMYRTPRRNHIYVGFDYHMMDINIQELIGMIPQLDTMMPMLRSFKGEAELHLAAETYTNAQYQIKPSTIRGAASIFGKDLVVMDNETFSTISKLLMFSKKTENRVDSISAEMTIYKKEIDVYPFCVSLDNYMVALGGRHNLDMTFNYDVNVLSPIYLGVNVSGNLDDLNIKLAPCKFAKDFKPLFHRKVDTQSAELRSMIRESMRKNVKI